MNQPLRIEFRDTSKFLVDPESHFVVKSLRKFMEVEVGTPGDICIYSCFGDSHLDFHGPKISIIGENVRPNFEEADFVIGSDRISDPRYLRFPYWARGRNCKDLMRPIAEHYPQPGEMFCAFIYSNPRCEKRNQIFQELSAHKFVESPGEVFNNTSAEILGRRERSWRASKIEYLSQFKFTIAAENSSYPGYTTEKIVDAFLAGSIPIYWGDPTIAKDFNPESFINVHDFGSIEEAVQYVLEISDDPIAIAKMRQIPPMTKDQWRRNASPKRLERFLRRAIEDLTSRAS